MLCVHGSPVVERVKVGNGFGEKYYNPQYLQRFGFFDESVRQGQRLRGHPYGFGDDGDTT